MRTCPVCGATGKRKDYWQTIDGRIIFISHLTDNHLKNIITEINNNTLHVKPSIKKKLLAEQKKR